MKLQKCLTDEAMETDEGPLINENSNGLSHLLTEGEFNSVDTGVVDESSTSNQGFLNAVELSTGSVGDYMENNTGGFNADSFDVGDNAVTFPSDSLNNALTDGDSQLSKPASDTDGDVTDKQKMETDFDISESETSCQLPGDGEDTQNKFDDDNTVENTLNDINDHINASNENSEAGAEDSEVAAENSEATAENSETAVGKSEAVVHSEAVADNSETAAVEVKKVILVPPPSLIGPSLLRIVTSILWIVISILERSVLMDYFFDC